MADAVNPEYSANIHLLKLDPQATTYKSTLAESSMRESRFAALNQNHYLLFSYRRTPTGPTDPVLRLVLAHIVPNAFQRLQVQSQQVLDFPNSTFDAGSYTSQITAIDDYFLVGSESNAFYNPGIFKVKQDGTIRRVSPQTGVTAFYKWQGKVYAQTFDDKLLVSTDNSETWTTYANTPSLLRSSGFRLIGDSLVGFIRPFNQLYSLRWNGGTGRVRELKNDGLGEAAITDIQQLGDTVYVGTTSGLFKRLKTVFFESKPQ
ncbi:hypothetical protein [Hymenobacter terricola]|uniref:hypothetical protein n=1 Tax=Hymenobacter terricola TaxID=2819236 RepID=UPI001B3092C2|nr:hypothetical protein [Hymenobacter terricola]